MGRSLTAMEEEKRKLKCSIAKSNKITLGSILRSALSLMGGLGNGANYTISCIFEALSDMSLQRLGTLVLAAYAFGGAVRPYLKSFISRLTLKIMRSAIKNVKVVMSTAFTSAAISVSSIVARLLADALGRITSQTPRVGTGMNTIHFNMDAPSNDEPVAAAHSPAMGHSADGDGVLFMMTSKFLASRRPYRLGNAVLMAGSSHGLVLTLWGPLLEKNRRTPPR